MAKGKRKPLKSKDLPEHVALDEANDEKFQKQIGAKKAKKDEGDKKGVVFLSHIPHGFYEPQMFSFFSQFGDVTRLKLIRSKKTGKSRSFAFIEFQYEEVAKVVAETMDNYLMYQKILKCKLLPLDEVRPLTFRNWQKKFVVPKTRQKAIRNYNKQNKDPVKEEKRLANLKAKREKLQKKLKDLGIDYDVMNIKINESFVPPESPRATAEEVAKVLRGYSGKKSVESVEGEKEEAKDAADQTPEDRSTGDSPQDAVPSKKSEHEEPEKGEENPETAETTEVTLDDKKLDDKEKEEEELIESINMGKESDTKNESDFGVMVVDLDDSDITFKSPPPDSRIRRRSVGISRKSSQQISVDEMNSPEQDVRKKRKAKDSTDSTKVDKKKRKNKLSATPGPKNSNVRMSTRASVKKKSNLNKTM